MTLKLNTGLERIPIERDGAPTGEIVFNPNEVEFRERLAQAMADLPAKQAYFVEKAKTLRSQDPQESTVDEDAPDYQRTIDDMRTVVDVEKEAFEWFGGIVNSLFGPGSSVILFGDRPLGVEITSDFLFALLDEVSKRTHTASAARFEKYEKKGPKRTKK